MRNFSNKLSSRKSTICSALLLSCAFILSTGSAQAANININVASGVAIESGIISGVTTITKTGAGELFLTGANTYSSGTLVNLGILRVDTDALPNTDTTLATSTTLIASSGSTVAHNAGSIIVADAASAIIGDATDGDGVFALTGTAELKIGTAAGATVTLKGPVVTGSIKAKDTSTIILSAGTYANTIALY